MHPADNFKYYKNKFDQLRLECDFLANALSDIIINLYFLGKLRGNDCATEPMVFLVSGRMYQSYLCLAKVAGVIPAVEIVFVKKQGAVRKYLDTLEQEMWTGILVICGQLYAEFHSEILSTKIGRKAVII